MSKVVFNVKRFTESRDLSVTIKGADIDVCAMLFLAMLSDQKIRYLMLKTVRGFLLVNEISILEFDKLFD